MDFLIERNSDIPVYRQLEKQISSMIKAGNLKPGDKLLPERDLAVKLGISRGTVKKAYEELARDGVVEIIQGKGSFIANDESTAPAGRKERAVSLISGLINDMINMKFSFRETATLFQVLLMERERKLERFHIAVIDCNPEALTIFEKQILYVSQMKIQKYLLDDVKKMAEPSKTFREFDLILTTTTHYEELVGLLPELKERLIKAAVSPGQQTIIEIASIPKGRRIGIFCSSRQFRDIIAERLKTFKIEGDLLRSAFEENANDMEMFLDGLDYLIVPPDSQLELSEDYRPFIRKFRENGGEIIFFEYKIQRGSLIYLEDQIADLLSQRRT